MPPRFSIVIPAYNEGDHLGCTLQALRGQDYSGTYEIVVVDNGSEDDTADIAAAYGAVVVHEPRRGVCSARQRGTLAARGDIVVSTDADTIAQPDWLTRLDRWFVDPAVTAVGGPCRYADPPLWARIVPPLWFGLIATVHAVNGRVLYITATNVAFRRQGFPGYDTALTQGGDEVDLLRRLRRQGRVCWDSANVVLTSARRLNQGLLHTVVISYGYYYVGARLVQRALRAPAMAVAPPVRAGDSLHTRRVRRRWRLLLTTLALFAVLRRRRTRQQGR